MNVQESLQQLGRMCLAGVTAFSFTFVLTPAVRWVAVRLGFVIQYQARPCPSDRPR